MIKHSSKVKVNDLQGIILVTSVVASATDKSEELSEKSQVGKLHLCVKHQRKIFWKSRMDKSQDFFFDTKSAIWKDAAKSNSNLKTLVYKPKQPHWPP